MKITQFVHQVCHLAGNIYLLIDGDHLALIDAGLRGSSRPLFKVVRQLGLDPGNIREVFITHADGDHAGGIGEIKAQTRAVIYASKIEAEAIQQGRPSRELHPRGLQKIFYGLTRHLIPNHKNPVDEVLSADEIFPLLGGLQVLATPGHTPGHISFYLPEKSILFAGDSIWMHEKATTAYGSEANTWDKELAVRSFQEQMALKPHIICAGHFYQTLEQA